MKNSFLKGHDDLLGYYFCQAARACDVTVASKAIPTASRSLVISVRRVSISNVWRFRYKASVSRIACTPLIVVKRSAIRTARG